MRTILVGAVIMTLFMANIASAAGDSADKSAIKTVMESMATMADRNEYAALENIFADEVEVDYTSLGGGEVEVKSNKALMAAWAGLLPGFDRTRHTLSNLQVNVTGNGATAFCDVTADHWINDLFWSVSGTYDFAFLKEGKQWRITKLKLNFASETGTRDVFGLAIKIATANPDSYVVSQKTRQTVIDFLTSLEERDKEKFETLWAEDAVQDMPFFTKSPLRRIQGKKNILAEYNCWFNSDRKVDYLSSLVMYQMEDPEVMYVEFNGGTANLLSGQSTTQRYSCLFHVENGKISLYRMYSSSESVMPGC